MSNRPLTCDMVKDCPERVTHIGEKGYVYCAKHAPLRQGWERTRKLRAWEVKQLQEGKPLRSYDYRPQIGCTHDGRERE